MVITLLGVTVVTGAKDGKDSGFLGITFEEDNAEEL
jgi:hypothetical protein